MEKYLFSHYKLIIGPSKELTPNLRKAVSIHNGVDIKIFGSKENHFDKNKIIKNPTTKIFCPRRWAPTKGIKYFAESLLLLDKLDLADNIEVYFAGNDYDIYPLYKEEIDSILKKIDRIKIYYLGNINVEDMAEQYKKSDIVIIPSLMEAVSLSALEAMASGCLVISTDVGGMPELINSHIDGILIPSKDSQALANAIKDSIENDLTMIVKNGHDKVMKSYTWDKIADRTINEINKSML